jgi:FAD/FMN-containing dehydrogenase
LFTGSFGTLGIITEVNFKLRPRPVREATIVRTGNVRELLNDARAILDARLFPVAAEILSADFAKRLNLVTDNSAALLIRFAGNEKGVAYQVEKAVGQLKEADIVDDDAGLWQSVAAVSFAIDAQLKQVPQSELANSSEATGGFWQIGALDGRLSLKNETTFCEDRDSVNSLMKRVKQQLDPLNILPHLNTENPD